MYTLKEIKDELNHEIEELEKVDPSWKNCHNCPFKGKCCIDNDIDIRDDEWNEIKHLLDTDSDIKNLVYQNFINNSKCYFRTEKCCLINDIRPTNCLYTPYQVVQNIYNRKLTFSLRSDKCDFTTKEIPFHFIGKSKYLIEIPSTGHTYLLLNHWYFEYDQNSENPNKEDGKTRLSKYFADYKI